MRSAKTVPPFGGAWLAPPVLPSPSTYVSTLCVTMSNLVVLRQGNPIYTTLGCAWAAPPHLRQGVDDPLEIKSRPFTWVIFLQNYFYFYLSKNNLKYFYFYLSTNVNYCNSYNTVDNVEWRRPSKVERKWSFFRRISLITIVPFDLERPNTHPHMR